MGTLNVLGRTQSRMGYNLTMQSAQRQSGREATHKTCTCLMEQMSKKNSKIVGCQKQGEGRGSLLIVKLQHHQFTNLQLMDQPLPHLRQRSRAVGHGQHCCWSAAGQLPQLRSGVTDCTVREEGREQKISYLSPFFPLPSTVDSSNNLRFTFLYILGDCVH